MKRDRARIVRVRRRILGPVHDLRTANWTWRELRRLRSELRVHGTDAVVGHPPLRISSRSGRVMLLTARLGRANCLERSLLRQAWLRDRGAVYEVVIGVRGAPDFAAHAWLAGDRDADQFQELHRFVPAGPPPRPRHRVGAAS
jgi:hypothetical protein